MFSRFLARPINITEQQKRDMFTLVRRGFRESYILTHSTSAEIIQNGSGYKVLRVWFDDRFFDYEVNSNRIVG